MRPGRVVSSIQEFAVPSIRLEGVTFAHHDAFPVLDGVSAVFPEGWTGLVGENGAGKSTLLRLIAGELQPQQGRIRIEPDGAEVVLCRQDVEAPGADVCALAPADDGAAWRLRGELDLEPADLERWSSLSPGERRRWQIAGALAREPRVLLLDEPTNHLDADGRALCPRGAGAVRGVGLLVSHDRALLEVLTSRTARLHRGQLTAHLRRTTGRRGRLWDAEQERARTVRQEAQSRERRTRQALVGGAVGACVGREVALGEQSRPEGPGCAEHRRADPAGVGRGAARGRRAAAADGGGAGSGRGAGGAASRRRARAFGLPRLHPGATPDDSHARRGRAPGRLDACSPVTCTRCSGARTGSASPGPNGAGKTTLLTRLLEANPGRAEQVFFLGQEVAPEEAASMLDRVRALPAGRPWPDPLARRRAGHGSGPAARLRRPRRPGRSGSCSSPRASRGDPGRWSWTSRPITSTSRPSSGSPRRSRPTPARCCS